MIEKKLNLPKKLRQCVQDLNHNGIKIRHKLKLTVALKNPDGHISELRATLPISIFISPNMPFDEQGNLVDQTPGSVGSETTGSSTVAPPGYGEHVLDQLYENVDMSGFRTPAISESGLNTPSYSVPQSRAGSHEDINAVTAAALSSRLQNMTLDQSRRNSSYLSVASSVTSQSIASSAASGAPSAPLSRSNSVEDRASTFSGRSSPDHIEIPVPRLEELNKVPSYATARKTPSRPNSWYCGEVLPDYESATAPTTPAGSDTSDPLSTIHESMTLSSSRDRLRPTTSAESARPRTTWPRPLSIGSFMLPRFDSNERRRSLLVQSRA
jgi:hypothetical protein